MKLQREDSARTQGRLVAAASEVFAEKDYGAATIAEICERAGTNVASVNYHFGDKETLYREAWRDAFRKGVQTHPVDGGVSDTASPEERLYGLIKALLLRITDENDREFFIVYRELANPTGLLDEVMQTEVLPLHQRMEKVVDELLDRASSPERVQLCTVSIFNQCISPIIARNSDRSGSRAAKSPRLDIAAFIDHVVQFSLGGIRAIRDGALQ
jgi:TetR/AcrR family transcriptional regulator, regulator of cefoperazone and chloramphenicol sensitivity